jgi:predicted small metal-binding protein
MPKLKCNDYGFECDFEVDGEQDKVIEDFRIAFKTIVITL